MKYRVFKLKGPIDSFKIKIEDEKIICSIENCNKIAKASGLKSNKFRFIKKRYKHVIMSAIWYYFNDKYELIERGNSEQT